MALAKRLPILALALAAIGCGQGNSGNVMAPQSNALTPAEVDKAQVTPDNNMLGTDMNVGQQIENSPAVTESASNNAE